MKNLYCLLLLGLLVSCSGPKEEKIEPKEEVTEAVQAEVLKSELKPYELTEELFVNSVEAEIYNGGESASYQYVVSVYQDTSSWNDTVTFYINKGDTARHLLVFAESESRMTKPASFTAKLLKLETK